MPSLASDAKRAWVVMGIKKKKNQIGDSFPREIELFMGETKNKLHPWRLCSKGFSYRGGTLQKLGGERKGDPTALLARPLWKCVKTTQKKDILHFEEVIVMSAIFLPFVKGDIKADALGFAKGNDYNQIILGWTKYWNDILQPTEELEPNLVKALIASESSFEENPKKNPKALGLMQITEETRKILNDREGELKDHYIVANRKVILEPAINICAGIRWLFHKKEIAKSKLKRKATWEEAVADYKSYLKEYQKDPGFRGMGTFRKLYERLKT